MAFKFVTVLCATLAFANAGLLQAPIAYSSAPAVSSVYSSIGAPSIIAAPAVKTYAQIPAIQTYQASVNKIAYSPAEAVSHVYSSIGAPSALSFAPQALSIAPQAYSIAPQSLSYGPAHQTVISSPAIGSSQQSTIRSFGGTVSHYSKAVDTAFSSVRKADTRISNNVYAPALATKTIAYAAAPAIAHQTIVQSSPIVSHVSFDGIGAHYAW